MHRKCLKLVKTRSNLNRHLVLMDRDLLLKEVENKLILDILEKWRNQVNGIRCKFQNKKGSS